MIPQTASINALDRAYSGKRVIEPDFRWVLQSSVSMQEAAAALAMISPIGITFAPEPIGDSSDGINPCGYDEIGG